MDEKIIGIVTSSFPIIHPGYILMLEEAHKYCDYLVALLQDDPSIDRSEKHKPILSLEERKIIVGGLKNVDEVRTYSTEQSLYDMLKSLKVEFDGGLVRILGSDHVGKPFTGDDLGINVVFNTRTHNFSSSNFRKAIHHDYVKSLRRLEKKEV